MKKKILDCNKLLEGRTTVSNKDIIDCLSTHNNLSTIYLDPPYYNKGSALYSEFMVPSEHVRMASILQGRRNWVLSYDDCPEIRQLYSLNKIIDLSARYCITGKKDNWESKNELIILGD